MTTKNLTDAQINRIALHTAAAAYRDLHAILDGNANSVETMSDTLDKLASALKLLGTNGEEALRGTV